MVSFKLPHSNKLLKALYEMVAAELCHRFLRNWLGQTIPFAPRKKDNMARHRTNYYLMTNCSVSLDWSVKCCNLTSNLVFIWVEVITPTRRPALHRAVYVIVSL